MPPRAPGSASEIAALRKHLRQERIAAREALPTGLRDAWTARIEAHLDRLIAELAPRSLAFCWPWRGEVDLVPWASRWQAGAAGRRLALPVVRGPAKAMEFLGWVPGMAMETDHHGIPVPVGGAAFTPELLLVPLNVFDAAGYRLGYGGGYFDRTLAALTPAPPCIGVAFELARAPTVHPQPHDQPMDWIVTEAGAVRATGKALSD